MKLRVYLYTTVRILFGVFLVLHSMYNVILYADFLQGLEMYFTKTTLFDYEFVKTFAPLVPFEEFTIGLFLIIGFSTRRVLMGAALLFSFLVFFLLDANSINLSLIHLVFFLISFILWKKEHYNLKSMDYSRGVHVMV
ncbi:hypothetical protein [Aquimarina rubra]|uniref:DoxX family membrane protein n=1 Tax=Aquimarina rubra TaxID=1920033 RepID=A0ABW5L9X4_9FLAO